MRNNLIQKSVIVFIIVAITLSLVGCGSESVDIDWTRGIYCESTQSFLGIGMTRIEIEQILGEGEDELIIQGGQHYNTFYRDRSLCIIYDEEIAVLIEILGEGFLVFGLSYGSSVQEILDTMGEPFQEGASSFGDFYTYIDLDDFNMTITFFVDSDEGRVVSIVVGRS